MKNEANKLTVDLIKGKMDDLLLDAKNKINKLKELNFIKEFPDKNINEINNILPQLKINNEGFASFDDDEVLNGFNLDPEFYKDDEFSIMDKLFFGSNKNFNIDEIITTISTLKPELEGLFNTSNNDGAIPDLGAMPDLGGLPDLGDLPGGLPDLGAVEKFKTKNATITVDMNK